MGNLYEPLSRDSDRRTYASCAYYFTLPEYFFFSLFRSSLHNFSFFLFCFVATIYAVFLRNAWSRMQLRFSKHVNMSYVYMRVCLCRKEEVCVRSHVPLVPHVPAWYWYHDIYIGMYSTPLLLGSGGKQHVTAVRQCCCIRMHHSIHTESDLNIICKSSRRPDPYRSVFPVSCRSDFLCTRLYFTLALALFTEENAYRAWNYAVKKKLYLVSIRARLHLHFSRWRWCLRISPRSEENLCRYRYAIGYER